LYVLTPQHRAVPEEFGNLLQRIGANVLEMTAEEHDATVALTSHLPQLLSTALAALLASQKNPNLQQVFGSGLLDMTRLAMSPAELWSSILATNQANVLHGIDLYTQVLSELRRAVQDNNLEAMFSIAAQFSSDLRSSKLYK
jgi:prephenate dehydrogenase